MPFRAIAEYTYDWETWVDSKGSVRWVNPAVERIAGYSVAQCLADAQYPLSLVVPADRPLVRRLLQRAAAGESGNHHEFRILCKDGATRWGAISFQPISSPEGKPLGYRTSVRDIDDQKKMEAELHAAVRRAEVASRAKTEFLANVSHELRTPLQSILGYAELLAEADLPTSLRNYAQTVLEQGKLLEHLVLDLLDSSSLQAGQVSLRNEELLLDQVIGEVLRGLKPMAAEKQLSLSAQVPSLPTFISDRRRLLQVLTNLVGNGIKFTSAGEVRVTVQRADGDELVLHVDDTGPGIAQGVDIFEPFQRGVEVATGPPGVGLGLAISRQFCRALGGDLVAGASPLGGARLTVTLPARFQVAADASEQTGAARFVDTAPVSPCRVLVVDDVASARSFLLEALRSLEADASSASTADDAYALADRRHFDLVLLDLHMPVVDGWAAVQGLRARLGDEVLIVALSAAPPAQVEGRLTGSGFDMLRSKPIDLAELRGLVGLAMERDASGRSADLSPTSELRTRSGERMSDWLQQRVARELPALEASLADALRSTALATVRSVAHDVHGVAGLMQRRDICELARGVQEAPDAAVWEPAARLLERVRELSGELSPS